MSWSGPSSAASSSAASAGSSRDAAALSRLGLSAEDGRSSLAVAAAYKRAIAAALTNPELIAQRAQQQQQMQSLAIAFHTLTNPDPTVDITDSLLSDPSQSGPALFSSYSRVWQERGVAWMRSAEEPPCHCKLCQSRTITGGGHSNTHSPQMSGANGAGASGAPSAWSKPPAILANSAAAATAAITTKATSGKVAPEHTNAGTGPSQSVDSASAAAISASSLLDGLTTASMGGLVDPNWSSSAFATSPLGPTGFLSSWAFPGATGPLVAPPGSSADFERFFDSMNEASLQSQHGQHNAAAGAAAFSHNHQDMGKSIIAGVGANGAAGDWNAFNALAPSQAQQQQQQWSVASSDAALNKSSSASSAGSNPSLFPSGSTSGASNSTPAESMEIVTTHFAHLTAQHGGQLPINQAALDSLIQSASAMPAGPEQQQLLAMIDMLLQLHTGQANQLAAQQQPGAVTTSAPAHLQQHSPQLAAMHPHQQPPPHFGQAAHAFGGWGASASNSAGGLVNPSLAAFTALPPFASSPAAAAAAAAGLQGHAATAFQHISNELMQHQHHPHPSSSSTHAAAGVGSNGSTASSLLLHLDDAATNAAAAATDARNGDDTAHADNEPAIAGVTSTASAADWMAQFQSSQSGSNDSAAAAAAAAASLLTEFSPLRPPRTATNAGYNDVPEAASPFSYDAYTNLSVSARPFQPTLQSSATATTDAAAAAAAGLTSPFTNPLGMGGANSLLLQQHLSAQLSQQNDLNASLAALQGVTAGSRQTMFDLVNGGGGGLFDPTDSIAQMQIGSNAGRDRDRRDHYTPRDAATAAGNTGGQYQDRERYGHRHSAGSSYHERRGGRANDYARSGMDRFDYIQQQVSQASKAKSRLFDDGRGGFAPQPNARSGPRDSGPAYVPDFASPAQLQSLQTQGLSQQQQQLLAQLLAQSITGGNNASEPSANEHTAATHEHTEANSAANAATDSSAATGSLSAPATEEPSVLSAEAALKQLTTSPEFQLLSPQQQAQIYVSVQQVQQQQQAAAAAAQSGAPHASSAPPTTSAASSSPSVVSVSPVLGALQSPLSSSVLNITPGTKVEEVLAQIMKPDLAKLSELLRQQQVAITNAALGNSSTPAVVSAPASAEPQPDKSKLRPPKPRARRTEFPDDTTATATAATDSAKPPSSTATPSTATTAGAVDAVALNQLQSVLSNAALSHSARVAVIRNVSASASATAFANAFVNAIVQQSAHKEEEKQQAAPNTATSMQPASAPVVPRKKTMAEIAATPVPLGAVAPTVAPISMRVRKRNPTNTPPTATNTTAAPTTASTLGTDDAPPVVTVAETDAPSDANVNARSSGRRERQDNRRAGNQRQAKTNQPTGRASTDADAALPTSAGTGSSPDAPATSSVDGRRRGQPRQPRQKQTKAAKEEDGTPAVAATDATDAATAPASGRLRGQNRRGPRAQTTGTDQPAASESGDAAGDAKRSRQPRGGGRGRQPRKEKSDGGDATNGDRTSAPVTATQHE